MPQLKRQRSSRVEVLVLQGSPTPAQPMIAQCHDAFSWLAAMHPYMLVL